MKYRELVDDRLRQIRFDRGTQILLEKARDLRTQRIAHLLEEVVLGNQQGATIYFKELKHLRDQLNDLLDALSFNVQHMMLPVQYSEEVIHPKGSDPRPDIERILDRLAASSALLNMPEEHPERWKYQLQRMDKQDQEVINAYRKKFGLTSE